MYILNEKDEARISKQVNDIAYGVETWRDFKYGAAVQFNDRSKTWTKKFAEREKEILCQTGFRSGKCNSCTECDRCIADTAFKLAMDEIEAGLRKPPQISSRQAYNRQMSIWVSKKGNIHITQWM